MKMFQLSLNPTIGPMQSIVKKAVKGLTCISKINFKLHLSFKGIIKK